jgi:hypothetical protein
MLTTLLRLFSSRSSLDYERAFITEVTMIVPVARNPAVERLILASWLLIVVKCFVIIWVINHWAVPIHPYWIIMPTILMAALGTVVYCRRN